MTAGVSILIAAYNAEPYIREAVDSALAQTDAPVEVIVVDDGSTDATAAVLRSYGERITFIAAPHRNAAAARNTAWKSSSREFVAILDADDRLSAGAFGPKLAVLEREPAAGVAYGDAVAIDEHGNRMRPIMCRHRLTPADDPLERLIDGNFFAVNAALIRRSVLQRLPYLHYEESVLVGDWDLWIRLADITRFAYAGDMSAEYRLHDTMSLRALTPEAGLRQTLDTLKRAFAVPGVRRLPPRVRRTTLRRMLLLALRLRSTVDAQFVRQLWIEIEGHSWPGRAISGMASVPGVASIAGVTLNAALAARRRLIRRTPARGAP